MLSPGVTSRAAPPVTKRAATGGPSRGRPRDPARDRAILDAALELVAEHGFDRMTVDALAARAGVSKPTIYRRWPGGKAELIAAAIQERRRETAATVDTGTLRGDLIAMLEEFLAQIREHAHLAAGLSYAMRESPELAKLVRERVVAEDRARFAAVLERAVARGELEAMPDAVDLLADVAPALIHVRALVTRGPLGVSFPTEIVDRVLLPALTSSTAPPDTDPTS